MTARARLSVIAVTVAVAALPAAPVTLAAGTRSIAGTYAKRLSKVGVYSGRWRIAFSARGSYTTTFRGMRAKGRWSVRGHRITFGHETGGLACRGIGTYTWKRRGKRLTFTARRDGCAPRKLVLTRGPWARSG